MYTSVQKKIPRYRKRARKISELAGKIIAPVISRRSGMTIDLIAAWPQLAGDEYRDFTRPEKINWPNRAHEGDPFKPGILIVACDSAKALFFQHDLSRICERVNIFFGFAAISKIKIVQKPIKQSKDNSTKRVCETISKMDSVKENRLEKILNQVDDPDLRLKLEKLGRGVMSHDKS